MPGGPLERPITAKREFQDRKQKPVSLFLHADDYFYRPGTTTTTLAATTATTTPSVPTTTTAVATTTKAQPAPAKTTSAPAPADNGDCMWGYGWTEMDVNIAPFRQGVCW